MPNSDFIKPPFFLATLLTSLDVLGSVDPVLSSRMAGFATGSSQPLKAHEDWLRGAVADKIRATPGCWVALYGHASLVGNAGYNLALSRQRIDAVEKILKDALKGQSFDSYRPVPRGVSDSFVDPTGNDPAFRSVEVFVYPPSAPRPKETFEEGLAFKRTVFVKDVSTQWDPPDPGDKGGKAGKVLSDTLIAELVLDKSKVAQSVARHPYEAGMPDLGDVRERRMRKLGKEEAMCSISITARLRRAVRGPVGDADKNDHHDRLRLLLLRRLPRPQSERSPHDSQRRQQLSAAGLLHRPAHDLPRPVRRRRGVPRGVAPTRHCERSEAIQPRRSDERVTTGRIILSPSPKRNRWMASLTLAMTGRWKKARSCGRDR